MTIFLEDNIVGSTHFVRLMFMIIVLVIDTAYSVRYSFSLQMFAHRVQNEAKNKIIGGERMNESLCLVYSARP